MARARAKRGSPFEWTWEGTGGADMTEMTGCGWAKRKDGELDGIIFIHRPGRAALPGGRQGLAPFDGGGGDPLAAAHQVRDEPGVRGHGLRLRLGQLPPAPRRGGHPVDGDTDDVPMQVRAVEKERAERYKRKFGGAASQRDLSPVTHVARSNGGVHKLGLLKAA